MQNIDAGCKSHKPQHDLLGMWSYGAQVSQPIFTGGALKGNLYSAESQRQQALIVYRQSIQRDFGDVSDALIAHEKLHQVRVRQQETVADWRERFEFPLFATRAVPRRTSKYSMDSRHFTGANWRLPLRGAMNIEASPSFIRHWRRLEGIRPASTFPMVLSRAARLHCCQPGILIHDDDARISM